MLARQPCPCTCGCGGGGVGADRRGGGEWTFLQYPVDISEFASGHVVMERMQGPGEPLEAARAAHIAHSRLPLSAQSRGVGACPGLEKSTPRKVSLLSLAVARRRRRRRRRQQQRHVVAARGSSDYTMACRTEQQTCNSHAART
jgi:hypothetical protein